MTKTLQERALLEKHRAGDGTFGNRERSTAEMELTKYTFPRLVDDLHPAFVSLNVKKQDGEWTVSAYPILIEDADVVLGAQLIEPFRIDATDEDAAQLDHGWESLAEAPPWLRDQVVRPLTHAGSDLKTTLWRKAEHDRILAAGGFCSAYDNEYIGEFEETYPAGTREDAAHYLDDMPYLGDVFELTEEEEESALEQYKLAVAELSRRAAAGLNVGELTDVTKAQGRTVYLAHLAENYPHAGFNKPQAIQSVERAHDTTRVTLSGGWRVNFPAGLHLPVIN